MREVFKRMSDGNEVVIEVNLDVEDKVNGEARESDLGRVKEMNPWLLSIFVKFDSLDENMDGFEEFLETKEALIIALGHNDRAIYAGSRVVDGWSEFYFYSYDSQRLDPVVKQILAPSEYVYESNIVRDTKWDFHEKQLLPTELELCHVESAKIIFLLQEEGEDLTVARVVEHYISFETPTQKNRFVNTLDLDGFSFKDEISTDDFEHGVALVKTHTVTEDEVKKVVDELFAKIKIDHGYYEGWSTTLVNQEEQD